LPLEADTLSIDWFDVNTSTINSIEYCFV